jgi:class 3 adenylate cyclase/predicted ATPase
MRCSHCEFENPERTKFCGQCSTPLSRDCTRCGFENPPDFTFCGQCGTALATVPQGNLPPEAERRHLTVMFCDQVDSMDRSHRLDPEEFREITRQYQEVCAKIIGDFAGQIGQYQGEGLLVYFGYPVAHEDDAQRAVRAGLGILAELPQLNSRLQRALKDLRDFPLQLHIGIHTGLTVVGEMGAGGRRELMVLGDTPNIASRLQGIAAPNTVVIGEATYRLVEGFFKCRELGPQHLKGISLPVLAYQVLQEGEARSRLEVVTHLTPLVGRKAETELLLERWERVKEGEGRAVLLSGEAGIGKSRLVRVLKERVAAQAHTWLEFRGVPYYQNSVLYPVIDLLQRALRFTREDSPEEKLRKLEDALTQYNRSLPEAIPFLALLLSLPLPDSSPPLPLTPQRQRQKILEVILAWLLAIAEKQPLLLVGEDLQWLDPTTLELLSLFIDQGPTARILTVLTFRPEFRPPWTMRSHLTQFTLSRLPRKQAEEMMGKITGEKTLPSRAVRQLVAKADGVPLFVEELTKTVLESGQLIDREDHYELAGSRTGLEDIPAALQDSLTARLDRLGTAKETAQLGATLGREFFYELLRAVSPLDETTLQRDLARLMEAELLYQKGVPPQVRYLFKHALIQDAAYQSLLKSKRQQVHQQIARVLEERFSETKETQPELLAHHYTEAGRVREAIPYWQRAGRRAVERSAHAEAISHLTRGLELLKTLPDTVERAQQELMLQLALGGPLIAAKGYGAPEVEKAYGRAFELCHQSGEAPHFLQTQLGLIAFYAMRGRFQRARQLGEQCLLLAQKTGDPSRLLQAQWALGQTLFHIGEFLSAREHVEHAIALYDPRQHRSRTLQDLGVTSHCYLSWGLWQLGYPDQALATSHKALTLAQGLSHSFSVAYALIFAACIRQLRGEGHTAQEHAEKAIAFCREQEFPVWLAFGQVVRGWALTGQGREEEGIAQIRQGLTAWKATGAEASRPLVLALLAEAQGRVGQAEEGLLMLEDALAIAQANEERYYEAELHRLKGSLTLQAKVQGPKSRVEKEAEDCFQQAIDIARHQSMKSLELRAVMSLSRLWRQQGKTEEARRMLAELYGWFTEGFDTADLRAAETLLEEMSRP